MCGSEARGVENARADLFQGATWFLTPTAATDPAHHRTVHGFVAGLGARPVAIDPDAHDRLVAITSHLPHAVANVLANQAGAGRVDGHDPLGAVGGSFRDMTRVAGANPRIWVDIFLDNREALLDGLREHGRRVEELARALEREDAGFLARWIGEAAGNRRRLLEAAYETVPEELYRVRVRVLDRPGVLSGITQALGAEGINIEDFELHHMSADAGGTARDRGGGRGRGPARGRPARRPGLRRCRDAGGRGMSDDGLRDRAGGRRSRASSPCRATSPSATARSCSGRSRPSRCTSAGSAPRPTRCRPSPPSRRSASRSSGPARPTSSCTAPACAGFGPPRSRSTSETPGPSSGSSRASSPGRSARSS